MSADRPPQNRPRPTPATLSRRGLRLGRVAGAPVYIGTSWLVLSIVVIVGYGPLAQDMMPRLSTVAAYSLAVALALSLTVSVLLHELGHALVARGFRIGVRSITLELLGGYTEMDADSPSARADLLVAIVGPIVSGVLGVVALWARGFLLDGTVLDQLALQLAWSNLVVAAFNALPGLPLDGGRALRAAVWWVTGRRHTGTWVAGWVGRLVAVATLTAGLVLAYTARVSLVSLVLAIMVAATLWQGATAAIIQAQLAVRLPRLNLRQLARPVLSVPSGTPLAEAMRQATVAASGTVAGGLPPAILVVDSAGRAVALVADQAAAAVPQERRAWVPVESVARTLEPGRTLAVDLAGEDVIRAVQANPAQNYLLVSGDDVVGVLVTADLARALES